MRLRLKIGIIQLLHKTLRYEVKAYKDGDEQAVFGWSEPTPEYTLDFLKKHWREIESAEYWVNATPVPKEALEAIAKMKEVIDLFGKAPSEQTPEALK